jgi:predicted DNA-binding protein with PD1-like motif
MSHPAQSDTLDPAYARQDNWFSTRSQHLVTRLLPGSDLKQELQKVVTNHKLSAASIVTCVGSLKVAHLRLAGAQTTQTFPGPFEIISLVGTLSPDGVHIHLCVSDTQGKVLGGHLLDGNVVHTTAEIALAVYQDVIFTRPEDPSTGYGELKVQET